MTDGTLSAEAGQAQPAHILAVDDDRGMRAAVTRTLSRRGHVVVAVGTAEDALRHLEEREFDVAILDVNLPTGDGIELLTAIKRRAPRTEAIMLSGYNSIEIAMRSVRAGAFDFIEKPYADERLIHTIDRAIEHRKLRQATVLYQAVQVIFRTRDPERLPEAIVKVSMEVMVADTATLLLLGLDHKFYVAHAFGLDAQIARTTRIALGEGVAGKVALSRTPLVIEGDVSRYAELAGLAGRPRVRSSIVYPLVLADEVFGILTFNRLTEERPFGAADLEKAGVLASQVLLALENSRLARQSATAEKLAAVGQLAAGIAHEISTPIQFIGDSLYFLNEAFRDVVQLVSGLDEIVLRMSTAKDPDDARALLIEARRLADEVDLAYVREAVPKALARTAEGAARIANIVRAVKEFGRPDRVDKLAADLNECLRNTLIVSHAEYANVADVETEFGDLPLVFCHAGELSQVFLHLIVNAGHAIADVVGDSQRRGKIVVRTRHDGDTAFVSIEDTGTGIPHEAEARVFDPFFTTKAVGRGTGLGLSIARTIVEKHGGSLTFETQIGQGTRFSMRLPVELR